MVEMVAVVPAPPLLVPELTAGAAAETAVFRRACLTVATRLATGAGQWLVVGADPRGPSTVPGPARGTFRGYGVDVRVSLAPAAPGPPRADLPLPVLVAGWLRGQVAPGIGATAELVGTGQPTDDCRRRGAELAVRRGAGTGLLVLGDGAITHTERAPGCSDRRAGPFDAAVARALADAEPTGLLDLEEQLATELGADGRAPWQVLAGLALASPGRWRGELLYSEAPYGVGYHVAFWRRVG